MGERREQLRTRILKGPDPQQTQPLGSGAPAHGLLGAPHPQAPRRLPGTKWDGIALGLARENLQGCLELSHPWSASDNTGAGSKNSQTAYPKGHYKRHGNSIFSSFLLFPLFFFSISFFLFPPFLLFILSYFLFPSFLFILFFFSFLFFLFLFYYSFFLFLPSYIFFSYYFCLLLFFFLFLFSYCCCCCCFVLSCSVSPCTVICITWLGLSLSFSKPEHRAHPSTGQQQLRPNYNSKAHITNTRGIPTSPAQEIKKTAPLGPTENLLQKVNPPIL